SGHFFKLGRPQVSPTMVRAAEMPVRRPLQRVLFAFLLVLAGMLELALRQGRAGVPPPLSFVAGARTAQEAGSHRSVLASTRPERQDFFQRPEVKRSGSLPSLLVHAGAALCVLSMRRRRGTSDSLLRARAVMTASASDERKLTVLYDGMCKVCLTNKALLTSQDSEGVLIFVNIAENDYNPREHAGIEFGDAMDELHVILPDGEILKGTPAVFRAYEAVGLGWAVGILGSPILRSLTDA
ncbi:unnamed protein product, partial [Polarella glacialis]